MRFNGGIKKLHCNGNKMTREKIIDRYEVLIYASFMICRVIKPNGFRLRDIEFCFNLVTNWIYGINSDDVPKMQLVQISRMIESYIAQSLILKIKNKKQPQYKISHTGMVYFFEQMVDAEKIRLPNQVIFIHYLLGTYGTFFRSFLLNDDLFQSSFQVNSIKNYLEPSTIVKNQISLLERRKEALEERIEENDGLLQLIDEERNNGSDNRRMIEKIDHRFSYQMAYQKPFKAFLLEIPSSLLEYELRVGFKNRRDLLFKQHKLYYSTIINMYKELLG